MKLYTSGEVEKILNFPRGRIRSFVRAGLITPVRERRSLRFSFKDLILLKTAKALCDSAVPSQRIARILASLKRQVPPDRHLSTVKIYADGRRIVVWDGKAKWQPDSGQFIFNFAASAVVRTIPPKRARPNLPRPGLTAEHWFNLGLELENDSVEEAQKAYAMAIELDPQMSKAHLNLGKLYHDLKDFKHAEIHYRAAAAAYPDGAAPLFNLGVLMEDLNRPLEAARAYRQAIKADDGFADAHYNLGLVCEALGNKTEAVFHLHAARKLYRGS